EDQGGNTIKLKHAPAAAARIGNSRSKLHGFWDTNAVMASMPDLPKAMPKEERRAKMDAARRELVQRFAKEEPKDWRLAGDVPLKDYAEAYANQILPVAREAHERLEFMKVRHQQDEDRTLAVGEAEEKAAKDGVPYYDWAAETVREQIHKGGWRLADLLQKALQ
ncbi:MAG: hypothetical protein H0T11_03685, partial [Chthoniobacterales bacterium]|nr:hypothetical protein [Chthoniobacterales bacterium]